MSINYAVFYSLEQNGQTFWYGTRDGDVVLIASAPEADPFYLRQFPRVVYNEGFVSIRSRVEPPSVSTLDENSAIGVPVVTSRDKGALNAFCGRFLEKVKQNYVVDPRFGGAVNGNIRLVKLKQTSGKPQLSNAKWNELLGRMSAVLEEFVDRA